jgi:hypothetical protein
MSIIFTGCNSSYQDCRSDCARVYADNFCNNHGGDSFGMNRCSDGTNYSYRETCLKTCGGN